MASSLFVALSFSSCGLVVVPPIGVVIVWSSRVVVVWSSHAVVACGRSFVLVLGRSCCVGGRLRCVGCLWHWAHVEVATSPGGDVAVVVVPLGVVGGVVVAWWG